MKNRICILFIGWLLFLSFSVNAFANDSCNWYFKKQGHNSPLFPKNADFITASGGMYIDKASNASGKKIIYLTFDAGYENGNIEIILDTLKQKEVPGAFFILSNLIRKNTNLVIRMADEGHKVCNHTANHKNLTKLTNEQIRDELKSLEEVYFEKTGKQMSNYFRFPEGCYSENSVEYIASLGYKTVFWSLAYADWDNGCQPSENTAIKKLLDNTHCGAIILLHPTSVTNARILPRLIDEWRSLGYEFGSLDDIK